MRFRFLVGFALVLSAAALGAQTVIKAPKNKYSLSDDIKLGADAAAKVEKEMPILRDDAVTSYVQRVGARLVDAIPPELQHPEFHYTFKVVNVREINAFALPGGPMYVNRGMIEAAHNEGEVAGVVAHELSHVALRHGTAQATKATKFEFGQLAGAVAGAIVGGTAGSAISQVSQLGIGTAFLRYSRDYEKQADLLGSHMMADAGYDPRDMAAVFRTIEEQGGSGGPQWLSDHPNPGNRSAYITKEAELLQVNNPRGDGRDFDVVKARLKAMAPAPKTGEKVAKGSNRPAAETKPDTAPVPSTVEPPASRYTTWTEAELFRISVPSNWRELPGKASVTFAPDGAVGTVKGERVFTHGVEVGLSRIAANDLESATDGLIESLRQANPRLARSGAYERGTLGGRRSVRVVLSNVSDVSGAPERITLQTTLMRDGSLCYLFGIAPAADYGRYEPIFQRVAESLQFTER
jgi:Zn-dependent protease with chaperone function